MKMRLRPRYYCDFCKKGSGSPSAMKRHEKGCTANPDRFCGLCARVGEEQQPLADLVAALGAGDYDGLAVLRNLAGNCPTCILAAIRASGLQRPMTFDSNGECADPGFHVEFEFRDELKSWWADVNNAERDSGRFPDRLPSSSVDFLKGLMAHDL
jgi:hypothetical protein